MYQKPDLGPSDLVHFFRTFRFCPPRKEGQRGLNFHTFQIPNVSGGTGTRHLIRDEPGIPLAFLLTGANVNDSDRSLSQVDAIASIREQSTNVPAKAAYLAAGLFRVVATQQSSRTFISRIETLALTT